MDSNCLGNTVQKAKPVQTYLRGVLLPDSLCLHFLLPAKEQYTPSGSGMEPITMSYSIFATLISGVCVGLKCSISILYKIPHVILDFLK